MPSWRLLGGSAGGGGGGSSIVVNVATLGAIADSALGAPGTDNTAIIQSALTSLASTGGIVWFPAAPLMYGTYKLSVPSGVWLMGAGYNSAIMRLGNLSSTSVGLLDYASASGCGIRNLRIDGNVTTPAGIISSSFGSDPMAGVLTNNTSIWLHGGCSNINIENIWVEHTGGYIILLDARTANILNVDVHDCSFLNNRPSLFGPSGDTNYGSWNGGIHYQMDGASATTSVKGLSVHHNTFKCNTGTMVWGHAYGFGGLHEQVKVDYNTFEDIGFDAVEHGNVIGGSVNGNSLRRIGYISLSDNAIGTPKQVPGGFATGIDTTGYVKNVTYNNNNLVSINGCCFSADGFCYGTISNNTMRIPVPGDLEYTIDSIATMGPGGSGANQVQGIITNNSVYTYSGGSITDGASNVTMVGNEFKNLGGTCLGLYGSQNSYCSGNNIYAPAGAIQPPCAFGNVGTANPQRAFSNTISNNNIFYSPTTPAPCVIEDSSGGAFSSTDQNIVFNNVITGNGNAFEFRKDPNTISVVQVVFSTNANSASVASAHIVRRQGSAAPYTSALQWYLVEGTSTWLHMQLQGYWAPTLRGPLLNISENGVANTGAFTTGNRTVVAWPDSIVSGKGYFDDLFCLTDTTYSNTDANVLNQVVGGGSTGVAVTALLRYHGATGYIEQSLTVASSARVWSPLGTISGGVDKSVLYDKLGVITGDANLEWDYTNQKLTILGKTGGGGSPPGPYAALLVTDANSPHLAYIQSDGGFLTTLANYQAIQAPNGSFYGRSANIVNYIALASAPAPSPTANDTWAITDGILNYDSTSIPYWHFNYGTGPTTVADAYLWAQGALFTGTLYNEVQIPNGGFLVGNGTVYNATPSTGVSELKIQAGANQSSGPFYLQAWLTNAAAISSFVKWDGTIFYINRSTDDGTGANVQVGGAVSAAGGFQTNSTSFQAIQTSNGSVATGGVWARSLEATNYTQVGRLTAAPTSGTVTPGDTLADGIIYYDTVLLGFFGRVNGTFVQFAAGTGSAAGSANWVQYSNGSGTFLASTNFQFIPGSQQLVVVGTATTNPGITLNTGYMFADGGFNTNSTNSDAIQAKLGGVTALSLVSICNNGVNGVTISRSSSVIRSYTWLVTSGGSLVLNDDTGTAVRLSMTTLGLIQIGGSNASIDQVGNISITGVLLTSGATAGVNATSTTSTASIQTSGGMTANAFYPVANASSGSLVNPASGHGGLGYDSGSLYWYWNGSAWATANLAGVGSSGSANWVQYSTGSGGFGASTDFQFIPGSQQVVVVGTATSNPGITLNSGYMFADGGFNTNSTNSDAIQAKLGGVTALSLVSICNNGVNGVTISRSSSVVRSYTWLVSSGGSLILSDDTASAVRLSMTTAGLIQVGGSNASIDQSGNISIVGVLLTSGSSAGVNATGTTSTASIQTSGGMTANAFYPITNGSAPTTPAGGHGGFGFQGGSTYWYYNVTASTWGTINFAAVGVGGSDTDIQYNKLGAMFADGNLRWVYGSQQVVVTGTATSNPGITLNSGYMFADGGFNTNGSNSDIIQAKSGGVTALQLISIRNDGGAGITISRSSATAGNYNFAVSSGGILLLNDAIASVTRLTMNGAGLFSIGSGNVQIDQLGNISIIGVMAANGSSGGVNVPTNTSIASIQAPSGGMLANAYYPIENSSHPLNPSGMYATNGGFGYKGGNVYWYYNSTSATWANVDFSAVTGAAGLTNQIQYNNGSGGFAADANLAWNHTAQQLLVTGPVGSSAFAALIVTDANSPHYAYIQSDGGFVTSLTNYNGAIQAPNGAVASYNAKINGNSNVTGDRLLQIYDSFNLPGISLYSNPSTRISQWRASGSYAFEIMNNSGTPVSIFEITQSGGVNMNTTGGSGLTINMGSFGNAITCNPAQGGSIIGFYSFIVTIGEMNSLWLPEYTGGLGTIPATGSSQMGGLAYLGTTNYAYWNGSAWASFNFASSGGGVPSITGTANQILVNGGTSTVTSAATLTLPTTVTTGAYIANASSGYIFQAPTATVYSVDYLGNVICNALFAEDNANNSIYTNGGFTAQYGGSTSNNILTSQALAIAIVSNLGYVSSPQFRYWNGSSYVNGVSGIFPSPSNFTISGGIVTGAVFVSDSRLKEEIEPYLYGMDAVRKLRPVRFRYNGLFKELYACPDESEHIGFYAQDVQNGMPSACWQDSKGYGSFDMNGITASLVVATQQADTHAKQTDARVATLEAELAELKRRLN